MLVQVVDYQPNTREEDVIRMKAGSTSTQSLVHFVEQIPWKAYWGIWELAKLVIFLCTSGCECGRQTPPLQEIIPGLFSIWFSFVPEWLNNSCKMRSPAHAIFHIRQTLFATFKYFTYAFKPLSLSLRMGSRKESPLAVWCVQGVYAPQISSLQLPNEQWRGSEI